MIVIPLLAMACSCFGLLIHLAYIFIEGENTLNNWSAVSLYVVMLVLSSIVYGVFF